MTEAVLLYCMLTFFKIYPTNDHQSSTGLLFCVIILGNLGYHILHLLIGYYYSFRKWLKKCLRKKFGIKDKAKSGKRDKKAQIEPE